MQHYLQGQGYFISLLFSHTWKPVRSEGLSHFSWDKVAWGVLSSCSSHGSKLPPLSGKQQRMGRICSQEVPAWTSARVDSLLVLPDNTCVSAAETLLEQPGLGLTFCCSTHGCSCLQNVILDCWLLCQSELPALQPRFQLCFAVDCFSVQLICWHHHKNASAGAWAGSACAYDLASWGIACVCIGLCVSLCYSSPRYFPAEMKSMLYVRDRRQGVTSTYCIFHMAWPYHFSVLILCCLLKKIFIS